MLMSSQQFNAEIPDEIDPATGHHRANTFKEALQESIRTQGIDQELSISITWILIELKKNKQKLSNHELKMIVGALEEKLIKPDELIGLTHDKNALILRTKESRAQSRAPIHPPMSGEEFNTSALESTGGEKLARFHKDFIMRLMSGLDPSKLASRARIVNLLISLRNSQSHENKITTEELNTLVTAMVNYPYLVDDFEGLFRMEALQNKELILAIIKYHPLPIIISGWVENLKVIMSQSFGSSLFSSALNDAESHPELDILMYLVLSGFQTKLIDRKTRPSRAIDYLESMKSLAKADIRALFDQKNGASEDVLQTMLNHDLPYSLPILLKMIEVLPEYAQAIAARLTPQNFAIKHLELERPDALVDFVNLLSKLKTIPDYRMADWEKLVKVEKDPSTELALLKLLSKHHVLNELEFLSMVVEARGVAPCVALWQENEKVAEDREFIASSIRGELFKSFSKDKHSARDAIFALMETFLPPPPAPGERIARMLACKEKYQAITNQTHLLYALNLENMDNKQFLPILRTSLLVVGTGLNSQPEARMVIALIAHAEGDKATETSCMKEIFRGAKPKTKSSFFTAAKSELICQAIISGKPEDLQNIPREIAAFIEAFEDPIRELVTSYITLSASAVPAAAIPSVAVSNLGRRPTTLSYWTTPKADGKQPLAQGDESDKEYGDEGKYKL